MSLRTKAQCLRGIGLIIVCLAGALPAWSQGMESVGQTVRHDSIRRTLEANLQLTEAKVKDLQSKVDAMKVCYAQTKMYTPNGCVALPPQKKSCTCNE